MSGYHRGRYVETVELCAYFLTMVFSTQESFLMCAEADTLSAMMGIATIHEMMNASGITQVNHAQISTVQWKRLVSCLEKKLISQTLILGRWQGP